jgi:hypothetical protein
MLPCRSLLRCASALFYLSLILASCNDDVEAKDTFEPAQQRGAVPVEHQARICSLQDDLARERSASAGGHQTRIYNLQNDLARERRASAGGHQTRMYSLQDDLACERRASAGHQARIDSLQNDLARERSASAGHQARIDSLQNALARERRASEGHRASIYRLQEHLALEQRVSEEYQASMYRLQGDLVRARSASAERPGSNEIAIPGTWQVSIAHRNELPEENDGGCSICFCYESFFQHGMCSCPLCKKFFCQECYRKCRRTRVGPSSTCPCCRTVRLDGEMR